MKHSQLLTVLPLLTIACISTIHWHYQNPTKYIFSNPVPLAPVLLNRDSIDQPDFKTVFAQRRHLVDDKCQASKQSKTFDPSKLFVLKDRHVEWCPVFKAGSSTWLSALVELSNHSSEDKAKIKAMFPGNYLKQGRYVAPMMTKTTYQSYHQRNFSKQSFIVVRHPFERLVSAYRDKLERSHLCCLGKNYINDFYYKRYGKAIVSQFRKKALDKFGSDFFNSTNNYGAPIAVDWQLRPSSQMPIFWEFVQYIIKTKGYNSDEHWTPTFKYCSMCLIKYDYILKFENYISEGKDFLEQSKLSKFFSDYKSVLDEHINLNHPNQMSR